MHSPNPSAASDHAAPAVQPAAPDWAEQIAVLRAQGAAHLDAMRLHYVEVLAMRLPAQPAPVQQLLEARLAQAVQELKLRMSASHSVSAVTPAAPAASLAPAVPHVVSQLSPLRALLADLASATALTQGAAHAGAPHAADNARPELKSVRNFRKTWSRLSTDKQLKEALDQAPKNAGPINSHMLVLRSLALMRDISPDYLNRFMSYADALLLLQDSDKPEPPAPKPRRTRSAP